MTALEQVQRLRELATKLEKAVVTLAKEGRIALDEESWHAIYEASDLACWTFGPQAADDERRSELHAVVEAATKIGMIRDR